MGVEDPDWVVVEELDWVVVVVEVGEGVEDSDSLLTPLALMEGLGVLEREGPGVAEPHRVGLWEGEMEVEEQGQEEADRVGVWDTEGVPWVSTVGVVRMEGEAEKEGDTVVETLTEKEVEGEGERVKSEAVGGGPVGDREGEEVTVKVGDPVRDTEVVKEGVVAGEAEVVGVKLGDMDWDWEFV